MKRWVLVLSFPLIVWGIERFCHRQTDGFSITRISSDLSFHPEWEVEGEIPSFFDQSFIYLGKGAQSFVFASQDGQYVLKLFQHYRMRPPPWASIPFLRHYAQEKIKRREALLDHDFNSYVVAFQHLKEETGLIFLHLNKTDHLNKSLLLVDKIGISHLIDLDKVEFLVQKRAHLVYPTIQDALAQGDRVHVKQIIDSLIELFITRCCKGIFDKDPDFATNFGLCDRKAIQIGVGRFQPDSSRSDPLIYKDDLIRATDSFCQWLYKQDPLLGDYLHDKVHSP